jgi:transcriptional regulator with XRE-family HTH domain
MGRPRKTQVHNDFNAALGRRIQKIRKARKMKCTQLARELGLVYQQIYNYEAGIATIPPHMLVLIAHALDVGVAELVTGF